MVRRGEAENADQAEFSEVESMTARGVGSLLWWKRRRNWQSPPGLWREGLFYRNPAPTTCDRERRELLL